MFWQEEISEENYTIPDTIQDVVFGIKTQVLPLDHIYQLSQALLKQLPWLDEIGASIHHISVADGNGWFNQDGENALFYPSNRSKLIIRLPKDKISLANKIIGQNLNIGNYTVNISKSYKAKKLSDSNIIFAKFVHNDNNDTEDNFLEKCYLALQNINIKPKKMLAGLEHTIKTNTNAINTRSLMIAGLRKSDSVKLQELGIGKYRLLGCGLFLPQKDIETVAAV